MSFPGYPPSHPYYEYWNCRPGVYMENPYYLYPPPPFHDTYHYYLFSQPSRPHPQDSMKPQEHLIKAEEQAPIEQEISNEIQPSEQIGEKSSSKKSSEKIEKYIPTKQKKSERSSQNFRIQASQAQSSFSAEIIRSGKPNKNRKSNIYRSFFRIFQDPELFDEIYDKFQMIKRRHGLAMTLEDFVEEIHTRVPKITDYFSLQKWRKLCLGKEDFHLLFRVMFEYFRRAWATPYFLTYSHRFKNKKNSVLQLLSTQHGKDLCQDKKGKLPPKKHQ